MSTSSEWRSGARNGLARAALAMAACGGIACAAVGCGPKTRAVPGEGRAQEAPKPRPAIETDVPLLRWIPANAELVVVADGLEQLEKLGAVVAPVSDAMGFSQAQLFASPWLRGGIETRSPIAVFTQGAELTVLASIAPAAVQDVTLLDPAWTPLGQGQGAVAALHWGSVQGPPGATSWVSALQEASQGQSYSSRGEASWAFARDGAAALRGHLPVAPLLAAAVGGEDYLSCLPLLTAIGGVRLEARLEPDGSARAQMQIQLSPGSADTLAQLLGPGPSPGMIGLRQTEAVHASVAVELPAAARALHEHQCPELAQYLEQAAQNMRWAPAPRALHLAGTRLNTGDMSGSVALHVDQQNKRFVSQQLDVVPGRSFFESTIRVDGQKVKRLSVPTMSAVYYQLTDKRLLFATKKSMMSSLLAPLAGGTNGEREVGAAGIWPARLPQLRRLLSEIAPSSDLANLWSDLLMRFEYAGLSLRLSDHDLTMDLSVRPVR